VSKPDTKSLKVLGRACIGPASEITNRQQVGFTRGQPFPRLRTLAFGTVPVAAAIVGDTPVAAVFASFDVAALRHVSMADITLS
jgi:hypothetical protein